ncbi:unnamed protein product [Rotaria sp. Silwood2]|nr:unnamed protein product [Rotaria sp. Silwood2]CAF4370486.1 unnamed protein product [Rotaria sp. Silwood2]
MCFDNSNVSQCLNGGYCSLNGTCICSSDCFVGNFCEINYNAVRFPLTGAILQDTLATRDSYIGCFFLFGFIGLINNILSLITFIREKIRLTVCGIYLILLSIFGIGLTFTIFTYIITIVRYKNQTYKLFACHFIPFIAVALNDGVILFTAAIAIERILIDCWNFQTQGRRTYGLIVSTIIIVYVCCSNIDEIFLRHISADITGEEICTYDFDRYPIWRRIDIVFSYTHVLIPCVIHFVSSVYVLTVIARRKIFNRGLENKFFHIWFEQLYINRDFFIPPICLIFCILPHAILGHLLKICIPCSDKSKLRLHISFVLLLFVPQMLSFILYVYPNKKYWKEFQYTIVYRKICCYFCDRQRRLQRQIDTGSQMEPRRMSMCVINETSSTTEQMETTL